MILKGEKVVLRPIRMDDAPRFVKWFNDPEVNKFVLIRSLTLRWERQYIKQRLKNPPKDKLHFCIDTKQGVHIGATAVEDISKRNKMPVGELLLETKNIGAKVMAQMQ